MDENVNVRFASDIARNFNLFNNKLTWIRNLIK